MKLGSRSARLSNLNHKRMSHHNGHNDRQNQRHNQCIRCNSAPYNSRSNFNKDWRCNKDKLLGKERCQRELRCL